VVLAAWIISRPVPMTTVRWWQSPFVTASISLTAAQREAIERMYEARLMARRRCAERLLEANNGVAQLMRQGVYDQEALGQTQAVALAAFEARTVTRLLGDEIVAVLTTEQRRKLAVIRGGRVVD
jgi:hypothetical protein